MSTPSKPHSTPHEIALMYVSRDFTFDVSDQSKSYCHPESLNGREVRLAQAYLDLEEQYAVMEENLKAYQQTIIGRKEQFAAEVALLKSQRDGYLHRVDELEEQLKAARHGENVVFAAAEKRIAELEEQYQTALDRLWEAHDQLCGCDKPADEGRCSAPEETWGAFEYLGEREHVSNPASSVRGWEPSEAGMEPRGG